MQSQSSTTDILQLLDGLPSSEPVEDPCIPMLGSDRLQQKIACNSDLQNKLGFLDLKNKKIRMDDLLQRWDELVALLDSADTSNELKVAIEECKLLVINSFEQYLIQKYCEQKQKVEEQKNISTALHVAKIAFFLFISAAALSFDMVGSYLFAQTLFAIIPGITNPWIICCSLVVCTLNAILFCGFEARMMQQAMGVTFSKEESKSLYQIYLEQVSKIKKVNTYLFDSSFVKKIQASDYKIYSHLAIKINKDLEAKQKEFFKPYDEDWLTKGFRWFVTGFGLFMSVAYGYFMASSFLALISSTLISNPIGWAIIGIAILTSIVFFLSMRGSGLGAMLNPLQPLYEKLKNKFAHVQIRKEKEFECVYEQKCRDEQFFSIPLKESNPSLVSSAKEEEKDSPLITLPPSITPVSNYIFPP
jgi:hypothetical protein